MPPCSSICDREALTSAHLYCLPDPALPRCPQIFRYLESLRVMSEVVMGSMGQFMAVALLMVGAGECGCGVAMQQLHRGMSRCSAGLRAAVQLWQLLITTAAAAAAASAAPCCRPSAPPPLPLPPSLPGPLHLRVCADRAPGVWSAICELRPAAAQLHGLLEQLHVRVRHRF